MQVSSSKKTVAVIGAGTAGLVYARRAAQLGIDVTVYDQSKHPGDPVRASGILSISGLESIGIGYSKLEVNPLYGATVHAGKAVMEIRAERPQALAMNRLRLNELCLDEAAAAGVHMELGKRLDGPALSKIAEESIIAGADGFNSSVARHFGFPNSQTHVLTYRAEYDANVADASVVELFFDTKISPGLFAWVAPESKTTLEAGIGISPGNGNSKDAFDRFIKTEAGDLLKGAKLRSGWASVIPLGIRPHFVDEKAEVMLIGDAAGQVKPTTGGGIIFGCSGALIAAETTRKYIDGTARLMDYERLWRKRYMADMRAHAVLRKLYSSVGVKNMGRAINMMNALGVNKFLGAHGDMDRPTLTLKRIIARWSRN